ncbi:MAG: class I SAM-dependent methyltransferase [Salinirussus sp.]
MYDVLAQPLESGRRRAIERLDLSPDDRLLVPGCGTGRDLEYVPDGTTVIGLDLTESMVERTATRMKRQNRNGGVIRGDAATLPVPDNSVDAIALHLVLSVVPDPEAVAAEAARVLRPDGRISIYDKFVPTETQPSLPRRLANPIARLTFADLNRSLEPMLDGTGLSTGDRESFLGGLYTVTVAQPHVA